MRYGSTQAAGAMIYGLATKSYKGGVRRDSLLPI